VPRFDQCKWKLFVGTKAASWPPLTGDEQVGGGIAGSSFILRVRAELADDRQAGKAIIFYESDW
jgi:hypothetical protein